MNINYNMQHITIASIQKLWNEMEIQFMVLLSFALQLFLFFTGILRRRHTNMLLRFAIWLSYLGADMVAVYALGLLSRYPNAYNGTNSLAFFWAPFLLVHLGGQDSITAFSIEDNNLWLRHLLNLLVEVSLTLYVCWKSTGRGNLHVLLPTILIFIAGVKYGERTWALKCGNQNMLWSSSIVDSQDKGSLVGHDSYSRTVCYALKTVPFVKGIFAGRTIFQMGSRAPEYLCKDFAEFEELEPRLKILEVELGLMYDVLYTKAMVTKTLAGNILRCVVISAIVVAFVHFHASKKGEYSGVDVILTYILLSGALFMEVCSFSIALISPWTWASLKAWNCERLSYLSWYLFKTIRPEKRRWWTSKIGQYNFITSLVKDRRSTSAAMVVSKAMDTVGLESTWRILRRTKYVKAKTEITKCVVEWSVKTKLQDVPDLGTALEDILRGPFENAIIQLHLFTDLHIWEYTSSPTGTSHICTRSLVPDLRYKGSGSQGSIFTHLHSLFEHEPTQLSFHQSLVKIKEVWMRLLVYAACKSRPEMHARQLGEAGELLTFIWLYIGAHRAFGDIARRFNLISPSRENEGHPLYVGDSLVPGYQVYLFDGRSVFHPSFRISEVHLSM